MARGKKRIGPDEGAVIVESLDELRDIVYCLKAEQKVVVMANGTFDLLHVGHLRFFKDAKSRGDYLVVAVNSDASVKKYKHAKLPIVKEEERMEVLSGLRWVDYIVHFDSETVDEVIRTIEPNIVAKGPDYEDESALPEVEREAIKACDAQVAICGDPKDHASSKIITRIRRLKWS